MRYLLKGREVVLLDEVGALRRVRYVDDEDYNSFSTLFSNLKPMKPTREENYRAVVETIRSQPISYYVAGWLASHESNIHVSAPPAQQDVTIEELGNHGVEFDDTTFTISTELTQGRSYSVVSNDFGLSDELELKTSVRSTRYYSGQTGKVSIQAKQFILDFLLDELHFKLGKVQNLEDIRGRVPSKFLSEFERGANV